MEGSVAAKKTGSLFTYSWQKGDCMGQMDDLL